MRETEAEREKRKHSLEARLASLRIAQLKMTPIEGKFDAEHLQAINKHIFQDMLKHGFPEYTPGEFRPETPAGSDRIKGRYLEGTTSPADPTIVAYSSMDEASKRQLNDILKEANPKTLSTLKTAEFTKKIADIYSSVDYIHPFEEGNSRTLRLFTAQLAQESGYTIEWEKLNENKFGRSLLYIARDKAVNAIAVEKIQNHSHKIAIINTLDRLEKNKDLNSLLEDIVKPSRAIAFEKLSPTEALKKHPELLLFYKFAQEAKEKYTKEYPDNPEAVGKEMQALRVGIQDVLNKGENTEQVLRTGLQDMLKKNQINQTNSVQKKTPNDLER